MRNIILTFTLVFITACTIGGEEASEGVATIESTTRIEVVEVEKTFEEGILDFAQCMREEGLNFPDPSFDIDGNPEFDDLNIENEEEFEEAFVNCGEMKELIFQTPNLVNSDFLPSETQILILNQKMFKKHLKYVNLKILLKILMTK